MGVRGQAGEWPPGPSVPETPVPPAAAAGRFPGPPASDATETAPSDAAPPATQRETDDKAMEMLQQHYASIFKKTHQ